MRPFLLLAPYFIAPLCMAFAFRHSKAQVKYNSYWLTGLIIVVYPVVWIQMENYFHPPNPGQYRCGIVHFSFVVVNTFILLPVSLLLQDLFLRVLRILK